MVKSSFFTSALAVALHTQNIIAQIFQPATNTQPGVLRSETNSPGGTGARKGDSSLPRIVPKAYIVELNDAGASLNGRSVNLHSRFHRRAEEEKIDYELRHEFNDPSLFLGLSVELHSGTEKEDLEALPEVRRVWPVIEVASPTPAGFEGLDLGGPVGEEYGFNTSVIRGADYKIDFNLKMAGVHHLHSKGVKGKGVKIAIIDSGVDYRHPALGNGFGPGKKVAFGRNYIDDGQGGPDDPIATCSSGGHGSHVAGIIAGEDPKDKGFGLLGVAPEATLGMYRVFGCWGGTASDIIMLAMIDAVNDGADILSVSLGADSGWEREDPFGQIITGAKSRGVPVIVADGNAGRLGPFLTGSPAIADDAVAVASADSARYPTTYKVKSNRGGEWRYAGLWPLEGEFKIHALEGEDRFGCSYDVFERAAATVERNGWDISKTIVMIQESNFCGVANNAAAANFFGFGVALSWKSGKYENPNDNNYIGSAPPLFIISMDHVDGPNLHAAVTANPLSFQLRFTDRRFLPVDNPSAGFTSNYSSFGNTWEFNVFKPQISAPGHLILSAWPLEAGGYSIISGTSMATPFVAGCYALLKAAYPDLSVDEMNNLFTTTAEPAKYWGDGDVIHSVSHQGAGLINLWNAYNSGARFGTGTVLLGQSSKPVARNITLTNTLGRSKTFTVSHSPAGLMQRTPYPDIDPVGWYSYGFPSKPVYADIDFKTRTTITLAPGETSVVSFTVFPPSNVDPDTIPIYSGFIKFVSGRDIYNVPYMGLPYVINEVPVLERDPVTGDQLPALIESQTEEGQNIYVKEDLVTFDVEKDLYFTMVYFARQPSEAYRLDLIAANTTFAPTYYGFNASNELETSTPELPVLDDFGGVESFQILFQSGYLEPVFHYLAWAGWLDTPDGQSSYLTPSGDYRLLLRILPLFKAVENESDWVSWLSPVLRVNGPVQ